ncbi:S-adenosyl-L-methionine-dependent methyltransferase [Chloropicon primus]|uniref:NOL1/NOP2/Sun domain family member 4 n=1 Tax=Chloropicon primus TaxID=1764295 RepID=A0A5B8MEX1_9CHLO|nr:S-adenosyl-L-methionine-dependent methyltransferase [Chloropicon primus]|mmetsp:Transcript_4638/g.13837  ORF Transcript_4638/g.13837 Transcript_4638/m.13837 type:complete len:364 (+) Transcript_4638:206-1297(+)|eukprot:QDZ18821.1 S-adenosyl-L-methionine-dependent methyltransferase [Chloropicon primus]
MDAYFRDIYGSRWPKLKEALKEDVRHVALANPFSKMSQEEIQRRLGEANSSSSSENVGTLRYHAISHCRLIDGLAKGATDGKYPVPLSDSADLKAWYWMDLGSLLPALALRIREDESVLDVCAAPGGKSLVLAQGLFKAEEVQAAAQQGGGDQAKRGFLVCNEVSASRRKRLACVVSEYFPSHVKSRIRLTDSDGTKLRGSYDKILVDAPCSSERHVLMQKSGRENGFKSPKSSSTAVIERWSPKQCKIFAKLQYSILKSALTCLKPGGQLVYSTCSIATVENDFVIEKILQKFGPGNGRCHVKAVKDCGFGNAKDRATLEQLGCERTKHGYFMLPDKSKFGPIYWCLLERSQGSGGDSEHSE